MGLACTNAEAIAAGACFTGQFWTEHEQKAIETYFIVRILTAFTGVDYNTDPSVVYALANDYALGATDDQLQSMYIGLLNTQMLNSVDPPAASTTKATLSQADTADAIACWKKYSDRQLAEIRVYALCYLLGTLGY